MNRAILFLILLLFLPTASATTVTTNSSSGIAANTATMTGNLTVLDTASAAVWFEFGTLSGYYTFKTSDATKTTIGSFSITQTGFPLMAGNKYYFRAVANDGINIVHGSEFNYILTDAVEITGYEFDKYYDELVAADLNVSLMTETAPKTFTDRIGDVFWGVSFGFIFVMMWIRHEDITIPSLLGMIVGGAIWSFMPLEWVRLAYSLMIVSFAGLVYSLIKKRS